ncbi:stress-responsive transcription factor hsf1 [Epicoccum nigrum]|nr:stress-responsive transcription factor hsf1 [Epicoccum nigrum]
MQTYPQDAGMPADQYMSWNDPTMGADMGAFHDPALFDNYGANTMNSGHNRVISLDGLNDVSAPDMGAGQLVRRNPNQQLAPAPRRGQWDGYNSPTQQWETMADDDEELEQKAAMAKKDAQAKRKQIPPFVQKLSSFLDNNKNENLIRWSDDGNSFIVLDEDEFARTLIPELFKHNNYASFVRQLNMYGFHKKVGLSDNSMKASETKAKAPSEYYNKYFKRGRPELLWLIQKPKNPAAGPKRKRDDEAKGDSDDERKYVQDSGGGGGYVEDLTPAVRRNDDMAMIPRSEYNSLRHEVRELQQQQKLISNVLGQIKRQNDELYSRATSFQALHDRHENSINAILTFLATFYKRGLEGNAGGMNLADLFPAARQQTHGNVVDVGDYSAPEMDRSPSFQRKRQPLALLPAPAAGKDYLAPAAGRATTISPTTRPMPNPLSRQGSQQSVFRTPSQTRTPSAIPPNRDSSSASAPPPPLKAESHSPLPQPLPEAEEILSAIQSANSASGQQAPQFDFPAAVSNYETADGAVPLTAQQRSDVLSLMAHSNAAAAHTNNALTNPDPPEISNLLSDLSRYQETQAQLELLQKMSEVQNSRVQSLQERLQPLSPSGQIPGLAEGGQGPGTQGGYFGGAGAAQLGEPATYDLDLDSFVQDNDYFPDHGGVGGGAGGDGEGAAGGLHEFNYDMPDAGVGMNGGGNAFGGGGGGGGGAADPFSFDDVLNQAQAQDGTPQLGVDSASSSGTSPAATVEEVEDESRRRSPKRSRRR